jgi:hypothetical protein
MPIKQSKDEHYTKKITSFSGSTYSEEVFPYLVYCDYCDHPAFKNGETAGEAADMARKDNFITVKAKSVSLPSKWQCKSCQEKQTQS